jgi:hypothetical protein
MGSVSSQGTPEGVAQAGKKHNDDPQCNANDKGSKHIDVDSKNHSDNNRLSDVSGTDDGSRPDSNFMEEVYNVVEAVACEKKWQRPRLWRPRMGKKSACY